MKFLLFFFTLFIQKPLTAQIITTVAGNGTEGYSGDNGVATVAQLRNPFGVAVDNQGNLYIADAFNNIIRKVNNLGIITTFAGTGANGYSGDGGPANSASLFRPYYVSVDNFNNVYFTDQLEKVIRKVNTAGIISTITGNLPAGYSGDGGLLILAQFGSIAGMSFDNANNMYITDFGNSVIRKVNNSGLITTIAGNGIPGFSGDGGLATSAKIRTQTRVAINNTNNNIYIADPIDNRIRIIYPSGIIDTYAGTGVLGYSGDGGIASAATMNYPWQISIDILGNLFVVDYSNFVVRKIDINGIISTYAGNGTPGYSGDGGLATLAQLLDPCGIVCDNGGNTYLVHRTPAHVVRKISGCLTTIIQQPTNVVLCNSGNAIFSVSATNTTFFQWQVNYGTGWFDLSNNGIYSGTHTNSLTISNTNSLFNGYEYRCKVTGLCGNLFSSPATLLVPIVINSSINISLCEGQAYAGHTSQGIYIDTLAALNGCDSIRTLNLTIIPKKYSTVYQPICKGNSFSGYSLPGIYVDTFSSVSGCDSIRTLRLSINPVYSITINKNICEGQNFLGHSQSGTYTDKFYTLIGCDSIVITNLIVDKIPRMTLGKDTTLCHGEKLFLEPGQFQTYLWQDGSTKNYFNVSESGQYLLTVTNGCGAATAKKNVSFEKCLSLFPNVFTPNGDGKNDLFRITNGIDLKNFNLKIFNRYGERIFETNSSTKGWDGTSKNIKQGIGAFIWQCTFSEGNNAKNLKGTVLLLR